MGNVAEQLLSILVMDFGYMSEPLYGHTPLRHQIAWKLVKDELDEDSMKENIRKMHEQAEMEKTSIARRSHY